MDQPEKKELMLGNEAIACGLIENGCAVATSYPGTPGFGNPGVRGQVPETI